MMRKDLMLLIVLGASVALSQQGAQETVMWPKPPEKAHLQFLYALRGKMDVGAEKSFWRKLADIIVGEEEERHAIVRPQGIAVDRQGRIYVSDIALKGVHIFSLEDKEYTLFFGDDDHRFLQPVGIAIARDGSMYVADSERGDILVFDADRHIRFTISEGLKRPTGICVTDSLVYATDAGSNAVAVFDLDGRTKFHFGTRGLGDGEFNIPIYLDVGKTAGPGASSMLCVVDALNFRLQMFDPNGRFLSRFGKLGDGVGEFARPKGVAFDSEGHIYVADALFDVVQVFDVSGRILLAFGGSGTGFGNFSLPAGIAIDARDRIYVVDSGNRRIQVFQYLR